MNRTAVQTFSLWFGIVYLLVGVLGFIPGVTQQLPEGELLLGIFGVNPLHNIAHLLFGAALVWGASSVANAVAVNRVLAVVFAVLVVAHFIPALVDLLELNTADLLLHAASALLTGYFGFVAGPGQVRAM